MLGHVTLLKMLHCKGISVKRVKSKEPTRERTSRDPTRKLDFKKKSQYSTCRVCLKSGSIPIFGHDKSDKISKGLYIFGGIRVHIEDAYPKFLCQPCNELLQGAILFRTQAQKSDGLLKQPMEIISDNDDSLDCDYNIKPVYEEITVTQKTSIEEYKLNKKPKEQKSLQCVKCNMSFETFTEFTKHKMTEEHENMKQKCPICHNLYSSLYYKKHMAIHNHRVSYLCDVCGKDFISLTSFRQHQLIHSDVLPYKCSQCPYRGRGKEALKMHIRSHTGERPYQCTHCPSRFISSSNLGKHMRTHKVEHKFRCDTCGKGFYNKGEMEIHIKVIHLGIRDHVCSDCGKAFGYRKMMMRHQLKVHKRKKLRAGKMPVYLKVEIMNQQKENTSVQTES